MPLAAWQVLNRKRQTRRPLHAIAVSGNGSIFGSTAVLVFAAFWPDYGKEGRVMLTTLTKEFFVPRFLERDEGVRENPSARYPWDGVSGVKPFRELAATTTVGVY